MGLDISQKQLNILVTGATGFLGKRLVSTLIKENYKVKVLLRENRKMPFSHKNLECFDCNVHNTMHLKEACKNSDIIIHLAAVVNAKNKEEYIKVNVSGTINLINCANINPPMQFIFISSVNVLNGNNYYALSKKEAEREVINSGLNYTILRPTMLYGPGDNKNIGYIVDFAQKWHFIPVFGNGEYKLQPLFIDDLVKAIVLLINETKSFNKVYNLGGADILSFNQMINLIKQTLNIKMRIIPLPLGIFLFFGKLGILPQRFFQRFIDLPVDKISDNNFLKDFDLEPVSFLEGLKNLTRNTLF